MDLVTALKGLKPKVTAVSVPDIDEPLYVRVMSGAERYVFEREAQDTESNKNGLVEVVFLCLCDGDGKRLFTDEKDKADIGEMPSDVLYQLFNAALQVNKINAADASDEVKP